MDVTQLLAGGGGVLLIVLSLIQISPLKLNPWSALGRAIGKAINGEVIEKVDHLEKTIVGVREDADERAAIACRVRILRFGDEVRHDIRHSKDHFDQTLSDITEYERYCARHPEFKNNMTVLTSQRIQEIYAELLETNDFL